MNSYSPYDVRNTTYSECAVEGLGVCGEYAKTPSGDSRLGGRLAFGEGFFFGESYTIFSAGRGGIQFLGWHWNV